MKCDDGDDEPDFDVTVKAGDRAGGDRAGGDRAGGDKAGGDRAGGDRAGGDRAGENIRENMGATAGNTVSDKAGGEAGDQHGLKVGGEAGGEALTDGAARFTECVKRDTRFAVRWASGALVAFSLPPMLGATAEELNGELMLDLNTRRRVGCNVRCNVKSIVKCNEGNALELLSDLHTH